MTVMAYVAELQALWVDQDNCDPLELYDAASIESGHKWIARRRVLKFLEGINKFFDGRKASLLHHNSLPILDEAIAAMAQEEVQLSLEPADEKVVSAPTFAVTESREWKETRDCFICGETGHLKWYCPTRGRGRGYNRGGSNGMAGGRGGYSGRQTSRDCSVTLSKFGVVIHERETRQMVGTDTRRKGLWYVEKGVQPELVYAATMEDKENKL
ncbi:hypothetical protein QYE76_032829 [Lolium multiflorum]|uniref:CCHC-type domain-containing protein n=1 Tax=Lolium multiflorum TaxID=4521 RepID=A0AAD8VL05_LOLMU|nr:hypothetical protein QYE76_032829 [Lolium multiflorum]